MKTTANAKTVESGSKIDAAGAAAVTSSVSANATKGPATRKPIRYRMRET